MNFGIDSWSNILVTTNTFHPCEHLCGNGCRFLLIVLRAAQEGTETPGGVERTVQHQQKKCQKTASVIDIMNYVLRLMHDQANFDQGSKSQSIDVVFVTYQKASIKSRERTIRGLEAETLQPLKKNGINLHL
ncbi:hypothetical protein CHS0354_004643 [Potamilus streckersoni]|uniref:Uncharacterized protein n=1 Tax=Potamilus streckersoni TaxID=2493646 RepID=A0AAE0S5F4_9BIVA|nr:hypothetical protein CHS0354_004643 [Potamilus streckersoni]